MDQQKNIQPSTSNIPAADGSGAGDQHSGSIDPDLPVQTADGNEVHIIDVLPAGRYNIIGVINYGGGRCKFMKWDENGTPKKDCTPPHENAALENVPGYQSATVHLNVYKDGYRYTTGYGYSSEELARKYALADRPLTPAAQVETTLVFPES